MNRLGFMLLLFVMFLGALLWYKKYQQKPLLSIAPQQCVFHMQDHWSKTFQDAIAASIKQWYTSTSNVDFVIKQMVEQYPEVESIHAQICSADKICFYLEGRGLAFVLNDQDVVNASGALSPCSSFDAKMIQDLPRVFVTGEVDPALLLDFVGSVSSSVAKTHNLYWNDPTSIAVRPKDGTKMQCLTRVGVGVTDENIQRCCTLHEEQLATTPKRKQKQIALWEYDIRFKNQIILRTGG